MDERVSSEPWMYLLAAAVLMEAYGSIYIYIYKYFFFTISQLQGIAGSTNS